MDYKFTSKIRNVGNSKSVWIPASAFSQDLVDEHGVYEITLKRVDLPQDASSDAQGGILSRDSGSGLGGPVPAFLDGSPDVVEVAFCDPAGNPALILLSKTGEKTAF